MAGDTLGGREREGEGKRGEDMDERGGRGGSRAEKGRATVAKKEKGERASEAKAVRHSGSDGGGGGSEPITYYNCLASERASERLSSIHHRDEWPRCQ